MRRNRIGFVADNSSVGYYQSVGHRVRLKANTAGGLQCVAPGRLATYCEYKGRGDE